MLVAALMLLIGQGVAPPTTVNGVILGTPEEFSVAGPARVCLADTSVDILSDETAYVDYLGIHWGSIRVVGPHGTFLVRQGPLAEPRRARLEEDFRGRTIASYRDEGRPVYLIYSPSPWPAGDDLPRVRVDGDALGHSRDRAILDRIRINPSEPENCARRFDYGWDMILEPAEEE